jgi:alpha,alpha-trehalose-phosphate synthase [UDP-forming]
LTWTKARLERVAAEVLGGRKFVVVSNREPYVHNYEEGRIVCTQPAGGLTAALKPIVASACGTWVAHGSGSADRNTTDRRGRVGVPAERPTFSLRRVWVPEQLHSQHYNGLSNQALWPLCHNVYHRPCFRSSDWRAYKAVNQLFAEAVLDEIGDSPATVFVQDYHLALLPAILKRANRDIVVGQFWHIPWPAAEIMQTFPWIDELLQGMLGNDLIGFHLDQHSRNFLETVRTTLPAHVLSDRGRVSFDNSSTEVRSAPISIDFERHSSDAASTVVSEHMNVWRQRIGGVRHVALGIDRLDYTKGLPERLRAFSLLLERRPELRGKVTLVQIAVPCRRGVPEFIALESEVDAQVEAINKRWATEEWKPILLEKRNLNSFEMMALHRLASVCLVTSLHDGMNLVAKEFVASRFDRDGVLILSRFAGAARELADAIQVNPFCDEALAEAISAALNMPVEERLWRMATLRTVVQNNNVYRWGVTMLGAFGEAGSGVTSVPAAMPRRMAASVA